MCNYSRNAINCKLVSDFIVIGLCTCGGRNWPVIVGCQFHPRHQSAPCSSWRLLRCQIKMHHVVRALVGWSVSQIRLKSQGLQRLSDMCQKSPGLEGCQLRLKPQWLLGCQLCLKVQGLTDMHQRLSCAVGLPDVCHSSWNMSSEVCHTLWAPDVPARFVPASHMKQFLMWKIQSGRYFFHSEYFQCWYSFCKNKCVLWLNIVLWGTASKPPTWSTTKHY